MNCTVSTARTLSAAVAVIAGLAEMAGALGPPFRITVVDSKTSRGVPLVELSMTNGATYVTDSAGVVAFDEPGLMGQDVWLSVKSHGYAFPKDGFGFAGTKVRVTSGGATTLRIERVNIAERLYRITGEGIYRDSMLLGDTPPIADGAPRGGVMGQDSVQTIVHDGKMFFFYGDTARASYPLGNFSMSGATAELPGHGGLDPSVGIDLKYFVGEDGFSRGMCPIAGQPGPVWLDGFVTTRGTSGDEKVLAHFVRVKTLGEMYEQGFAQYDEKKEVFEPVKRFPPDELLYARGHPVRGTQDGTSGARIAGEVYWYFPAPFPTIRCRDDYASLLDPSKYEAYTCLQAGARYEGAASRLDRDARGTLVYAWKRDTAALSHKEQDELVKAGMMKAEETLIKLRDAATGKEVLGHAGSVYWNDYRQRWVMIVQEIWGTSMCGEVWYAESPRLIGPWENAVKIITHDDYSFYNVMHHPEFDQDGGRIIYLEGTYTMAFSGTKVPTPRYDYNQIMYRLDLDDRRLEPARK